MRKAYRYQDNAEYWDKRWQTLDKGGFDNLTIYPVKFAEMVVNDQNKKYVEIGAGGGRVLRHYLSAGFDIVGIERSEVAVKALTDEIGSDRIKQGDALALPFDDQSIDVAMAFGVYHNLEQGLEQGIREIHRILRPGGTYCISMRPDNLEMRLNEVYFCWRNRSAPNKQRHFHKLMVQEKEFIKILADCGLQNSEVHRVRNVSLLWRLPFLRKRQRNEAERRASGYQLNAVGKTLDAILTRVMPYHTANVLVFIGQRPTA